MKNVKKLVFGMLAMLLMVMNVNADAKEEFTTCLTSGEEETCTLTESIDVNSRITVEKNVTIDLGGKTITLSDGAFVLFKTNNDVVISNGTINQTENTSAIVAINQTGKVTIRNLNVSSSDAVENKTATVQVGAQTSSGYSSGSLVVEDGTVITGSRGVSVFGSGSNLEIKGGEIDTSAFAISGNGNSTQCSNSTIIITGGTMISNNSAAIYHPQSGNLNIEGGTIKGLFGVVARQGTINITGGTITAVKGEKTEDSVGDAGDEIKFKTGTAIVVDNVANYGGEESKAKVTVSGNADITADVAVAYNRGAEEIEDNSGKDIEIKGGKVSPTVDKQYLGEGVKQSVSGKVGILHNIATPEKVENGTVTVNANAVEGETVVIKVTANEGYIVKEVSVSGAKVTKNTDGTYSFVMPNKDVTVTVNIELEPKKIVVEDKAKGDKEVTLSKEADEVLKDSLINTTDKELQELLENNDVTVELQATKVEKESLAKEKVAKFESVVKGATVTEYFDLSILVEITGEEVHYLRELSKPITLTIDLPELPEVAKGYERKYYIIREHDGVYEKLNATLTDGKLSFATDKFSTYALAYADEEIENPSTFDGILSFVTLAITSLGVAGYSIKKYIRK